MKMLALAFLQSAILPCLNTLTSSFQVLMNMGFPALIRKKFTVCGGWSEKYLQIFCFISVLCFLVFTNPYSDRGVLSHLA
jgi:hypothetical protein